MKNSADEKRVIADVRPQQKCLFRCCAGQRNQHVRNVLFGDIVGLIGDLQPARMRKRFKQRRDIIAKFSVADFALLQNMPGKNVKIKLGRYPQVPAMIQDGVHQSRMIENRITRFDIAQKINERNLVGLRARERAHYEVEISRGKPRPTIRSNHRGFIMRDECGDGKPDY